MVEDLQQRERVRSCTGGLKSEKLIAYVECSVQLRGTGIAGGWKVLANLVH